MNYEDRVEYRERVVQVAWRGGSIETNESKSRVRGIRVLVEGEWTIYSTTEELRWEQLEERIKAISRAPSVKIDRKPVQIQLHKGRVALGRPAGEPVAECLRVASIAKSILQEKGLTGEIVAVYSESQRTIIHHEGTSQEDKVVSELYIFAETRTEGTRYVGSSTAAWLGPPAQIAAKDIEILVEKAARRSVSALRAKKISPLERGAKTVILAEEASAAFFHELAHMLEADNPEHVKPGTLVSTTSLQIKDDPFSEASPASMVFDDEAAPTRKRSLVEDGVVVGLLHTRETASVYRDHPGSARGLFHKPKAMHTTLAIGGGDWKEGEVIEETREGILIDGVVRAELWRGIVRLVPEETWIVSRGEVREPVKIEEVRVPLIKALTSIDAVGRKTYLRVSYDKGHIVAERSPWIRTVAYVF
uniref:TldD/PmbA family protein n=1 Tax=Fervidicoccus fontis TaxID=683846 RepID=A0A7J3ZLB9_9CREN